MFQKFKTLSRPETAKDRVAALRNLFEDEKIDAYLIPKSDEYLGEYIAPYAERLAWLTSFTGSAGYCLILKDQAIMFTDGRYTSQVKNQCDNDLFSFADLVSTPPATWLKENAAEGLCLGLDPWLLPGATVKQLEQAVQSISGSIVVTGRNLIDKIWDDQPSEPLEPVSIQKLDMSGQLSKDKIASMKTSLLNDDIDAFISADPTSIAWLFNIRGADIAHTPACLTRAIIHKDKTPDLFIDKRKCSTEVEAYLTQLADLNPPSEFSEKLKELGMAGKKMALAPNSASHAISMILAENGAHIIEQADPVIKARAIKNDIEIKGTIDTHKQDGAAMVQFIAWLEQHGADGLDEISVAKKLEQTRQEFGEKHQNPLKDISFDTISGSGPNAAIIHYRVDEQSNRKLHNNEMILIDSGGQYVTGTTDITRTIGLGEVPEEQKKLFTLVLKGMIDISTLMFPSGTRGIDIDILARAALWQQGMDYAHGTGHGVGSYLSVHEGPQSISRRSMVALESGMILSNEPGYYRDGAFGIRIENLILVGEAREIEGGDIKMHTFETLTLCPIDRKLILPELLTRDQLNWINAYHQRVYNELLPLIDDDKTREWLKLATKEIT